MTMTEGAASAMGDVYLSTEGEKLPRMIMRQLIGRPRWFRRLLVGAYRHRAELALLDAAGEIPAVVKRPDDVLFEALRPWGALEAKTHAFAVSPAAPAFDLLLGLFDAAVSAAVLPVIAFAIQAPSGVVVRLPRGGA